MTQHTHAATHTPSERPCRPPTHLPLPPLPPFTYPRPARRSEEERQREIVEVERRKLLVEAAGLRDYLPKGVLRDQGDLAFIEGVLSDMAARRSAAAAAPPPPQGGRR